MKKDRKNGNDEDKLVKIIQKLVLSTYVDILQSKGVKTAIEKKDDGYFFEHDNTTNKSVDKRLERMAKQLDALLLSEVDKVWKRGEKDLDENEKDALNDE